MKIDKKVIIGLVVISVIFLVFVGFMITRNNKFNNEQRVLRFYEFENGYEKEYQYSCKTYNCSIKKVKDVISLSNNYIDDEYYTLVDGKTYLYNSNKKEKIEVEVLEKEYISKVFLNDNNEEYAIAVMNSNFSNESEYLYFVKSSKKYLTDDNNTEINFMKYLSDDEIEYINLDLILSINSNGHFRIIDYKNNQTVFDTKNLNLNNDADYFDGSINPIKIKDNEYYYDLYYENIDEVGYILDEKFEKLFSYSTRTTEEQQYGGNQYSIDKDKIYIINVNRKSFSIYDFNGILLKKSKDYSYVYCVAEGYFLVRMSDGGNWQIIDSDEKVITKIDVIYRGGNDIDVEGDIITVRTGYNECEYIYKYDLKTNKMIEKSENCFVQ